MMTPHSSHTHTAKIIRHWNPISGPVTELISIISCLLPPSLCRIGPNAALLISYPIRPTPNRLIPLIWKMMLKQGVMWRLSTEYSPRIQPLSSPSRKQSSLQTDSLLVLVHFLSEGALHLDALCHPGSKPRGISLHVSPFIWLII